jgi:hypothetical protein
LAQSDQIKRQALYYTLRYVSTLLQIPWHTWGQFHQHSNTGSLFDNSFTMNLLAHSTWRKSWVQNIRSLACQLT